VGLNPVPLACPLGSQNQHCKLGSPSKKPIRMSDMIGVADCTASTTATACCARIWIWTFLACVDVEDPHACSPLTCWCSMAASGIGNRRRESGGDGPSKTCQMRGDACGGGCRNRDACRGGHKNRDELWRRRRAITGCGFRPWCVVAAPGLETVILPLPRIFRIGVAGFVSRVWVRLLVMKVGLGRTDFNTCRVNSVTKST
jgi:hypothetical protein